MTDIPRNIYISIDVITYLDSINFSLLLVLLFSHKIAHGKGIITFIKSLLITWGIGLLFLLYMDPELPFKLMIYYYLVLTLVILLGIMLVTFILRNRFRPIFFIILNFVIVVVISFSILMIPLFYIVFAYHRIFLSILFSSVIIALCPLLYLVFAFTNKHYRERLTLLLKLKINQSSCNKEELPLP
jgi:hypothetical protein